MRFVLLVGLGASLLATAQAQTPRQACMADYQTYCAHVRPGGGRVKQCLHAHRDRLTDVCRAALDAAIGKQDQNQKK